MIKAGLFVAIFILAASLVFPSSALAVTVTVTNNIPPISQDPFNLEVSVYGAQVGTNYLRVDLYRDGTGGYFGETFVNGNWQTPNSDGTLYFPIQIVDQNATASATLQARFGSPSPSDYIGPGNYKLKIRRYTSQNNYTFSDTYDVNITVAVSPSPSPSSNPSPSLSPSQSPSPSPSLSPSPSIKPSPSPLPKLSPSPKPSPSPSKSPNALAFSSEEPTGGQILGLGAGPTSSPEVQVAGDKKFPLSAVIFITGGLSLVGLALYMFFKGYQNEYNGNEDKSSTE